VYVRSGTEILVGDAAWDEAIGDPAGLLLAPKRILTAGETRIEVAGQRVAAHRVVAAVLSAVVARAVDQHNGHDPARLVLTHPENWSQAQLEVLVDAAGQLGFDDERVELVSEPRAAAAYCTRAAGAPVAGGRVVVFDLGAGTLDVAVLATGEGGGFTVVAEGGNSALGGNNFDAAIRRWVGAELAGRDPELSAALAERVSIREQRAMDESIRRAKELLSEHPRADIDVAAGAHRQVLSLTRGEFEGLIDRDLSRAVTLTRAILHAAGPHDSGHHSGAGAIYLIGGSSRIPLVHRRIGQLGPIVTLDDPETVLARGALLATATTAPTPRRPEPEPDDSLLRWLAGDRRPASLDRDLLAPTLLFNLVNLWAVASLFHGRMLAVGPMLLFLGSSVVFFLVNLALYLARSSNIVELELRVDNEATGPTLVLHIRNGQIHKMPLTAVNRVDVSRNKAALSEVLSIGVYTDGNHYRSDRGPTAEMLMTVLESYDVRVTTSDRNDD
jgi:molecular chaperone DnaK (HSP70)